MDRLLRARQRERLIEDRPEGLRCWLQTRLRSGLMSGEQRGLAERLFGRRSESWTATLLRLGDERRGRYRWESEEPMLSREAWRIERGLESWVGGFATFGPACLARLALTAAERSLPVWRREWAAVSALPWAQEERWMEVFGPDDCDEPWEQGGWSYPRAELEIPGSEDGHQFQLLEPTEMESLIWEDLLNLETCPPEDRLRVLKAWLADPSLDADSAIEGPVEPLDPRDFFQDPAHPGAWVDWSVSFAVRAALLIPGEDEHALKFQRAQLFDEISPTQAASMAARCALRALGGSWGALDVRAVDALCEAIVDDLARWGLSGDALPSGPLAAP